VKDEDKKEMMPRFISGSFRILTNKLSIKKPQLIRFIIVIFLCVCFNKNNSLKSEKIVNESTVNIITCSIRSRRSY
jgi:hypothetical protein